MKICTKPIQSKNYFYTLFNLPVLILLRSYFLFIYYIIKLGSIVIMAIKYLSIITTVSLNKLCPTLIYQYRDNSHIISTGSKGDKIEPKV